MQRRLLPFLASLLLALTAVSVLAQLNRQRGNGPNNLPQLTFFAHRLGTDHAEGITTLDMNCDGRPDLLRGANWYELTGPQVGDWKRHQYRTVEYTDEFVSACGEWSVDVNHDGAPDLVTVRWQTDGFWWYEN